MKKNNFIYFIKSIYCFRKNIIKFCFRSTNHNFHMNELSVYYNPIFHDPKGVFFFMAVYTDDKDFYLMSKGPKHFRNFILRILKKYHE